MGLSAMKSRITFASSPGWREIDRVSGPVDHDEDTVGVPHCPAIFVDSRSTRASMGPGFRQRPIDGSSKASSRSNTGYRASAPEHPKGARKAEPQIVRHCHA